MEGIGTTVPTPFGDAPTRWIQMVSGHPELRLTGTAGLTSDFYIVAGAGLLDRRSQLGTSDESGFDFTTNATTRMVIDASGKVGIGTTSPSATLHVIGDFIATGSKSAMVQTASFGTRQLYTVESAENWFEDFGSSKLLSGQTVVKLDPVFAETVSTASG